jgi:hypothetical protein
MAASAGLSAVVPLVFCGGTPQTRRESPQRAAVQKDDNRDALNRLADSQDEQAIRSALGKQDLSVEDADAMVRMTGRRVDRREGALERVRKLLAVGTLPKSEVADVEKALAEARREHEWL